MRVRAKVSIGIVAALAVLPAVPAAAQSLHAELNGLATKKIVGEMRRMELSHDEHRAVEKIKAALSVKNYSNAAAAIDAAAPIALSNDAKFVIAGLQLQLGAETHNVPLQDQAIDAALASGVASKEQAIELYRLQGRSGLRLKNFDRAESALNKYIELAPTEPEAYVLLAEAKHQAGKPGEALSLLERAIALKAGAKQAVPAKWIDARAVLAASLAGRS